MKWMRKLAGTLLVLSSVTNVQAAVSLTPSNQNLFVATTGEVSAVFLGSFASYISDLYLVGNPTPLFNSRTSNFLDSVSNNFTAGTELSFALFVRNTASVYYTGSASNNLDNTLHFAFYDLGNNNVLVGVEDLWKGGDRDYNDMAFMVQNVRIGPVPEPESFALFLSGIALVGVVARRKVSR